MIISLQSKDNATLVTEFEKIGSCVSAELFIGKTDGHKFQPGQKVQLVGLEDYPEFNGEIVTITSIRMDGEWGKAYYFKTNNPNLANQLNWTYEYRLRIPMELKESAGQEGD